MFDYLIHISDIHIRLSSRFEEYQLVFDRFRESIKNIENAMVVCTGDLFHQKNELTPDCILFTIRFLQDISSKHKVIIIPGNHDFLMNNFQKCDSITSILIDRSIPNVEYLRDSGIYRFDNIIFVHNSLWNPENTEWIDATTITKKEDESIVSLFHGQVGGCKTQLGFTLRDTIPISVFDGSDMVLLGDIHKHQFLQPHIAYAGSMVSQNFGETDEEHGYLLWDISKRNGKFQTIMNDYSYRQIDILGEPSYFVYLEKKYDDIREIIKILPLNVRLQILIHDISDYDTDKLRKKFQPIQPRIRHLTKSMDVLNTDITKTSSSNNIETHLHDYLVNHNLTDPIYIEKLRENLKFDTTLTTCSSSWKILELSFDYLFGYGLDNKIVFDTSDGSHVIGIFGSNSIGKSTIIDIIVFMLYGRITRYASGNTTPKELIHEKQKFFQASLQIQVGGVIYTIHKKGKRDKHNKIKITEEMFQGGENLTEEHRGKTDKIIRELIGSVEQFLSLSMCLQVPDKSFRQMTQKERKEYLYTLFRLDSFEEYRNRLSEENKKLQIHLNTISSQTDSFEDEDIFKDKIDTLKIEYNEIKQLLTTIEIERKNLEEKWKRYTSVMTRKKYLENHIEDLRLHRIRLEKDIKKVKSNTVVCDEVDVSKLKSNLEKRQKKVKKIRNEIDTLRTKVMKELFAPSCEEFSFSRYIKLKKIEYTSPYTITMPYVSKLSNEFSYFKKDELKMEYDRINLFEETNLKKINKYFDKIDVIHSEEKNICMVEKTIREEYHIHQNVEYNSSCEKCMCNPFRERKEYLGNKLKEKDQEKKELSIEKQKLEGKISKIMGKVISPITREGCYKHWREKKQKIMDSMDEINVFEKMMNIYFQRHKNKIRTLEYDEYTKCSSYIQNLGKFLFVRINNRVIDHNINEKDKEKRLLEDKLENDQRSLIYLADMENKIRMSNELQMKEEESVKGNSELIEIKNELVLFDNIEKSKNDADKRWMDLSKKECMILQCLEQQKKQFQEWKILIKKKNKWLEEIRITKDLIRITDRNGFPSYILKMLIPDLNQYMNNILTNFTERQIKLGLSEEGEVLFHTQSDDSDLMIHFYGGMESLMIDLATKITFSHFAYCPMSSFFILDENISVLDEHHIQNIEILFDFLKQHYHHVLLISHLPHMKNVVDKNVTIIKTNGYSQIQCCL